MKFLWNDFMDEGKPEWLTWNDVLEYEKKMCANEIPAATSEI